MIKLITDNKIGILGVEEIKGLFIYYDSYKFGRIKLEFFKNKSNGLYYYLVDNPNISNFKQGKSHNDIMIIHDKIEKLINMILSRYDYIDVRVQFNKLFKYKKYQYDNLDINDFIKFINTNIVELKQYIKTLEVR